MKKSAGIITIILLSLVLLVGCAKKTPTLTKEAEETIAEVEPILYRSFSDAGIAMVLPEEMRVTSVTEDGGTGFRGSTDTVTFELTLLDRVCEMNMDALKELAVELTGSDEDENAEAVEPQIVNLNGLELVQVPRDDGGAEYFILSPDGDDYRLCIEPAGEADVSDEIAAIVDTMCPCGEIPKGSDVAMYRIGRPKIDYLVLVNKENPMPEAMADEISVVNTVNSEGNTARVERTAYKSFMGLRNALIEDDGIYIEIDTALRTVSEQEELTEELRDRYGDDYVRDYVAVPGYSEHHTGLAMDIYFDRERTEGYDSDDEIWSHIHQKLADYGYILRYPSGSEDITGYSYEPWHIRYVGADAAREIYDRGITLEEWHGAIDN